MFFERDVVCVSQTALAVPEQDERIEIFTMPGQGFVGPVFALRLVFTVEREKRVTLACFCSIATSHAE